MLNSSVINKLLKQFSPKSRSAVVDYEGYEAFFRSSEKALEGRIEEVRFLVEDINARSGGVTSWLDIGCGAGSLLSVVKSQGIVPYGIEMDDGLALKALSESPGIFCGSALNVLEKLTEVGVKFDVVSCLHLIEHMDWDNANLLLELMRKVSSNEGMVVVVTPNTKDIDVVAGSFYRDPTHIRQYPPELLDFMFQRNQIKPVYIQTFNRFYDEETLTKERRKFTIAERLFDKTEILTKRSKALVDKMVKK